MSVAPGNPASTAPAAGAAGATGAPAGTAPTPAPAAPQNANGNPAAAPGLTPPVAADPGGAPASGGQQRPEQGASSQQPSAQDVLIAGFRTHGYDIPAGTTDSAIIEEINAAIIAAQEYEQFRPHRETFAEYTKRKTEFDAWVASQNGTGKPLDPANPTAGAAPAAPAKPPAPWEIPPVDDAVNDLIRLGYVFKNDAGDYEAKRPMFAEAARQLNDRELHTTRFTEQFKNDPQSVIKGMLGPIIEEAVKPYVDEIESLKKTQSTQSEAQFQEDLEKYFKANSARYFQLDQSGNAVIRKGADGREYAVPNARGTVYAQTLLDLEEDVPDARQRHKIALKIADAIPDAAPPQPGATTAPTAPAAPAAPAAGTNGATPTSQRERKLSFLQGRMSAPDPALTPDATGAPAPAPPRRLSAVQKAKAIWDQEVAAAS